MDNEIGRIIHDGGGEGREEDGWVRWRVEEGGHGNMLLGGWHGRTEGVGSNR